MSEVEREKKSLPPLSQLRYSDPLKARERKGDGRLVAMRAPPLPLLRTLIVLPLYRNASPDRRNASGRTSDYTVRNTWWRQSCTAHPREKCPGRIPRSAYFFLCLEFLDR